MIATTFAMYLLLYIALIVAYIAVLFHLARRAQDAHLPGGTIDPRTGGAMLETTGSGT